MGQEEAVTKLSCRIQEVLEGGKKRGERKGKRRIFNEVISIFCFPEWVHKEKCPRPGKGDRPWHQPGKNRENLSAAAQAGVTGSCGPVVQPQRYTPATPVWPAAEASVSPCANTRTEHHPGWAWVRETSQILVFMEFYRREKQTLKQRMGFKENRNWLLMGETWRKIPRNKAWRTCM